MLFKESKERENHKYIARVKVEGTSLNNTKKHNRYRYFYTRPAYQAYLKNQYDSKTTNNKANKVKTDFKSTIQKGQDAVDKTITTYGVEKIDTKKQNDDAKAREAKITNLVQKISEQKRQEREASEQKILNDWSDKRSAGIKKMVDEYETEKVLNSVAKDATTNLSLEKEMTENNLLDKLFPKKAEFERRKEMAKIYEGYDLGAVASWDIGSDRDREFDEYRISADKLEERRIQKPYTMEEAMEGVNPNYETGEYGWTNNCTYCMLAYELRRRGYDVTAKSITSEDVHATDFINGICFERISVDETIRYDLREDKSISAKEACQKIEKELLAYGEGARGSFSVQWKDSNYGHAMNWEIVNNKVIIIDSQSNEIHDLYDFEETADVFKYTRLDNLRINANYANRFWR